MAKLFQVVSNDRYNSPQALKVLSAISQITTKPVEETSLPLLFLSLPDIAPPRNALQEHLNYRRALNSLTTLCVQPALFETLVIRLCSKLDTLCSPMRQPLDDEADAAYAHAILLALKDVLVVKIQDSHADILKYVDQLAVPLYWIFIRAAVSSTAPMASSDPRVVSVAAKIVTLIVRSLALEYVVYNPARTFLYPDPFNRRQGTFASALFTAYQSGKTSPLLAGRRLPSDAISFSPFSVCFVFPVHS